MQESRNFLCQVSHKGTKVVMDLDGMCSAAEMVALMNLADFILSDQVSRERTQRGGGGGWFCWGFFCLFVCFVFFLFCFIFSFTLAFKQTCTNFFQTWHGGRCHYSV